jgi:hypothetical protein
MSRCPADLAAVQQARPRFRPLVVGVHWPSLPWGDESFGGGGSFAAPGDGGAAADPVAALVDDYAGRIADTPAARDALRTIVSAAVEETDPPELPPDVLAACKRLNLEADLGVGGVGGGPGSDRDSFDPEAVYQALQDEAPSFGGGGTGGVLGVLRTLSFWRMKDRARRFGETAGSKLLARMMQAAPRDVRFHLMGHSFGCVVMSATLAGPGGRGRVARPVESLALVQGALSIWSYCDDIPFAKGQPGYFYKVVADRRVRGPIVSTQSVFDTAVGRWYPLGAGVARQVAFSTPGELPKYGAVGAHGMRGPGVDATDLSLLPVGGEYAFTPGRVYNLECSGVVRNMEGSGGAHSDICHPELAHAVWQAALAAG